ncbi:MAG: transcription-repair coupling factor [Candidatus Zixiibacteriota bacterium]|nr:MAG: transcription-repair coupling factor [candidate division Zixibacteria bacterium]
MTGNKIVDISVCGLSGSSASFILNALSEDSGKMILAISPTAETSHDLYDDLSILLGESKVGYYPARQILPYDFKSPIGEIIGQRISTLSDILENRLKVVVCPVRALIEPTISFDVMVNARLNLIQGKEYDLEIIIGQLVKLGFKRVSVVEEVGDFAVRGGLIDFFTPGSEAPIRVEFFGDEIETIRHFEVATQRTINRIDKINILPKREIPITQKTLEKYLEHLPEDDSEYIRNRYLNDPELPGLEWLSVMFGLPQGSLLDFIDSKGILFLQGEGTIKAEIEAIHKEAESLYERLNKHFINLSTPDKYYHSTDKIFNKLSGWFKIDNLPFRGGRKDIIDFKFKPHPSLGSRLDILGNIIKEFDKESIKYLITTDTAGQVSRLSELISEKSNLDFDPPVDVMNLKGGFVCKEAKIAILTDHEIFSRYHRKVRKKKFKEGVAISDYSNLTYGDYVVHTDYGIARFLGLETLNVDNRNRDCLHLKYANDDKLYVPIEEFNRVSKYSGKDTAPSLTALGGVVWEKLKKKTKKAVELMAEDLLKLYAERKTAPGYAFGEDTVWLKQLEASFMYDETRDQLKAIGDVKHDMELEQPMDRLVCGDVGYGKTEVAVRAVFKAIEESKQAALLVPTTILAQQHFQTFSERFKDFPMKIGLLSRFRTRKEQLKTLDELAVGKVDMVVGTHRLLSKDVVFKDLGLLIVDEEHRFGVRHKEKLRSMKSNVDTISMTATPIPRSLHMSLMGVRDMSIISSSPKDRLPIITEITDFEPAIIATSILREIDRGGQVFFVHNRVQTIDAMYNYLKKLLPQVEIAIAHGQMHEKSLEGIMLGFLNKRFDVLLCTSIIESGLDIPSANTIIINRADRFGLAQLYQIRGRVGRSSQRAYAYLLTPPIRLMKADAVKRMRAIEAHSDLGAGFALAMRDLEIRGSGTILGTKQSGYIEEIGFDLYNRMLDEAISELQGKVVEKPPETKLEIDIETHLSNEYINIRQQKVDIYRRIADARKLDDIEQLRDEVIDRFGNLPDSAENLFNAAAVRISASVLEIEKVSIKKKVVNIFFEKGRSLKRSEVEKLHQATDCPMEFSILERTQIILDMKSLENLELLKHLRGLLGKI